MSRAPKGRTGEPVDAARHRPMLRLGTVLAWALVQLAVLAALYFSLTVAGVSLTLTVLPHLLGTPKSIAGLPIGVAVAVGAGIWINHNARAWVRRLMIRRLRAGGVDAMTARVTRLESRYHVNARGPGSTVYTVHLRWTDRRDGTEYRHLRRYRFYGHGSRRFEELCATGARVPVFCPEGRPHRVVVDIPFAPMMVELLL
ncbi:MAG: hypothetical protein WCA46_28830 [Actinocatenispora sp.]